MAATDVLRRLAGFLGGLLGLSAAAPVQALNLPEDKAEALIHVYDGGGVRASGPAFLVRKNMTEKISVQGSWYVDAVSNASVDVVTTASPFKETRNAVDLSADYLVRDSMITLGLSSSKEPDYDAKTLSVDIAEEVFGGMTTVGLGFSRGSDKVGKKGVGWIDTAKHWNWRLGVTQVLTPRWIAAAKLEISSDSGYLGNPYRAARVFGAAVPENLPRTRTGRALKFSAIGSIDELLPRAAVRAEYRYYWDSWAMKGHTVEVGGSRYFGDPWLADVFVRAYKQNAALFYADDAATQTLYVTRNRQLSDFSSLGLGGRLTYSLGKLRDRFDAKLTGAYEYKHFNYGDYTDLRTGNPYKHGAHVLQVNLSATY